MASAEQAEYIGAPYVEKEVLLGRKKRATVFGSSSPQRGSAAYDAAKALGALLARKGYAVVNGGYWGTMAASAEGAVGAGGEAFGVVASGVFLERHRRGGPAPFLTGAVDSGSSIMARIALLLESDVFVVLPGQLGTLQELVCVWNEAGLAHLHDQEPRTIFAWRDPWESICRSLITQLDARNPAVIDCIQFVDGVDDIAARLC